MKPGPAMTLAVFQAEADEAHQEGVYARWFAANFHRMPNQACWDEIGRRTARLESVPAGLQTTGGSTHET